MEPKSHSTARAFQVRPLAVSGESAQVSPEYSMKAFFSKLLLFLSERLGFLPHRAIC